MRAAYDVTAVLWDIDGTLITSGGVGVRAFLDAVADVTGIRPHGAGLDLGGRIDPEIALTLLDGDEAPVPAVLSRLAQLSAERAAQYAEHTRLLPGVSELVDRLQQAQVRQSVVTGNIEVVARLKLGAVGLVPPIDVTTGGFGDSGTNRTEVARHAVTGLVESGWALSPSQCWIIGDTPRDLHCAQALGLRCALVGSGQHPASSLAGLGADVVLPSLAEPDALFTAWGW